MNNDGKIKIAYIFNNVLKHKNIVSSRIFTFQYRQLNVDYFPSYYISRISFNARNSLKERERQNGNEDQTKITKSNRAATRQRQHLRLGRVWFRLFTLMKSQLCIPKRSIGARRCTETRTGLTSLKREEDRKRKTVQEIKEEPVIGISTVLKSHRINYRSCKGVENDIDRRREGG